MDLPLHVNVGGGGWQLDAIDRTFRPDTPFVTGGSDQLGDDAEGMSGFGTRRVGPQIDVAVPVPDGDYALLLSFLNNSRQGTLSRFDVFAEGELILDDIGIFGSGGQVRAAQVAVADGQLDARLVGVDGPAHLAAFSLVPLDASADVRPYTWPNLSPAAAEVVAASHLRAIGQGLFLSASEDRFGRYPDTLAELARDELLTDENLFASPRAGSKQTQSLLDARQRAALAAVQDDFVYLAAGERALDLGPDDPIAHEDLRQVAGSIIMLFGDGRVERLDRSASATLLNVPAAPPSDPAPPPLGLLTDPGIDDVRQDLAVLAHAAAMYEIDFNRQPDSLGQLYDLGYITAAGGDASTLLSERVGTVAPFPEGDPRLAVWLAVNTDYALINQTDTFRRDLLPVIHEKSASVPSGSTARVLSTPSSGVRVVTAHHLAEARARLLPPEVTGLAYDVDANQFTATFSEWPMDGLEAEPLWIIDVDGSLRGTTGARFDQADNTRRFTLGELPNGDHVATLGGASHSFFTLAGDANRDRVVNLADFGILRQNFGQAAQFTGADFDRSGRVDLSDFGILRANFGTRLDPQATAWSSLFGNNTRRSADGIFR